jgi:hypothetical protein
LQALVNSDWRRLCAGEEQRFLLLKKTMLSAAAMAEHWIARRDGLGFVVALSCSQEYLGTLQGSCVVSAADFEYRLPVSSLSDFHKHMHGRIELVATYGCLTRYAA